MPRIVIEVTPDIAKALDTQARGLMLRRRAYVRAVLAAVAEPQATPPAASQEVADASA